MRVQTDRRVVVVVALGVNALLLVTEPGLALRGRSAVTSSLEARARGRRRSYGGKFPASSASTVAGGTQRPGEACLREGITVVVVPIAPAATSFLNGLVQPLSPMSAVA